MATKRKTEVEWDLGENEVKQLLAARKQCFTAELKFAWVPPTEEGELGSMFNGDALRGTMHFNQEMDRIFKEFTTLLQNNLEEALEEVRSTALEESGFEMINLGEVKITPAEVFESLWRATYAVQFPNGELHQYTVTFAEHAASFEEAVNLATAHKSEVLHKVAAAHNLDAKLLQVTVDSVERIG